MRCLPAINFIILSSGDKTDPVSPHHNFITALIIVALLPASYLHFLPTRRTPGPRVGTNGCGSSKGQRWHRATVALLCGHHEDI